MKLLFLAALATSALAEHRLYLAGTVSKGHIVGTRLKPSGLFLRTDSGWWNVGLHHPNIHALDFDPRNPKILYLAAGNGCLKSLDGGYTWAQTTGWEITEPQAVSVDPQAPDHVYLALPDGIYVSRDGSKSWQRAESGLAEGHKYTQTIRVDRTSQGRVIAGTESGVYLTTDGGEHWRAVGAAGAMVNHVAQSPHDPKVWIAVTQAHGALLSRDGGESWNPIRGVPKEHSLYNASFDPRDARRIAICGWGLGVVVSADGGATWTPRNAGLPNFKLWRVAFDPDAAGRLWVSPHEEPLQVSGDAGATWKDAGLDGSRAYDFVFIPDSRTPFAQRAGTVIDFRANVDPAKAGYANIAAMLKRHRDTDAASARLIELLKDPTGDMFWMFPTTAIAFLDNGQLTPEAREALRRSWKTYFPYRGDTENHWLLYYTCLYLMSQKYPDDPGTEWFTGKSSAENRREAEEWILHWMNLTTTIGQGEYDCTHYIGVYFLPLSYLAEWSNDPKMRQRAKILIEWIMADFAVELLDGVFAGSHARTDDRQVVEKWAGVSSDFAWALFGLGYPQPSYSNYLPYYLMASAYEPPEIVRRIATDREKPYLHTERKRTRHRWRIAESRNGPVYKTMYMTPHYAVGSDQGGVLQPIQQHSWDVTWRVPDPRGIHNTIFSMHPYSSPSELQTYFPVMQDAFIEEVVRSKPTYDSPDKLLGGSPFERIYQDRDTVVALYNIPEGTRFPHVNGFFSKDLRDIVEHPSGWIFARGGDTFLAYRPLAPYTWAALNPIYGTAGKRLYSPHLRNGTIVQAAAAGEFSGFAEFQRRILALPLKFTLDPVPSVRMTTLRGAKIDFAWDRSPSRDGRLFAGPFLNAESGERRLILTHGNLRRVLDFSRLTVE